ncbi:MAG: 4-(cytidine 5'-diphospho)-2-C-methyl-D-erythritol kinase, partial [Ruminococcus sp.]|nr:4-(cytidine 5'-diphospho)-2-C-methyl-D-erythritol kinase [Ruminococcus sp.]
MEIKVLAPAKINLSLEVLGKRPDGYHEISTVMQAVSLYDTITLADNDSESVTISCNYKGVPCDDSNICAKAAYRFFDYCRMDVNGVHIDIDKKIPTQAGLAGGSSDGAAVV